MTTPTRIAALRHALDERTVAEREHGARLPIPRAAVATAVCAEALVDLLELLATSSTFGGRLEADPGPDERPTIDLMGAPYVPASELRARVAELEVELERAVTDRDRLAGELEEAKAAPPPAPARPQSEHLARTAEEALGRAERRNAALEAELATANEHLERRGRVVDDLEHIVNEVLRPALERLAVAADEVVPAINKDDLTVAEAEVRHAVAHARDVLR
jgi:hypothetical protein